MNSEPRKELRYVKISIYRLRACAVKEFIRPTPFPRFWSQSRVIVKRFPMGFHEKLGGIVRRRLNADRRHTSGHRSPRTPLRNSGLHLWLAVADRHKLAAYHNKHCRLSLQWYQHR